MRLPLRSAATAAAVALVASGCGLLGGSSLSTPDEVRAALLELADSSMRVRATAEVTIDEDEVRAAVLADDRLRTMMDDAAEGAGDEVTTDDLLADLQELQAELARHAVQLARADDGSVQMVVETDGQVWADVRARAELPADEATTGPVPLDLQLQLDLDVLATVMDDSSFARDLQAAGSTLSTIAPDIAAGLPAAQPLLDVLEAFLAGDRVALTGSVDAAAWRDALGPLLGGFLEMDTLPGLGDTSLDVRDELRGQLATALSFDDFRTEGSRTLVNATVNLRATASAVVDRMEETAGADPAAAERVAEARAALADLPEQLTDVATLAFDADGALDEVRVDMLDLMVQLGAAHDPDDEDLAALAEAGAGFEETGAFLVLDVMDVGAVDSLLGEPAASVTWDQLLEVFESAGALLGPMFGAGLASGLGGSTPATDLSLGSGARLGVRDVGVRDCFDDEALDGLLEAGAEPVFPCALPHDNEVFATVAWDAGDGSDATYDACLAAFTEFVGADYLESSLFFAVLEPTSAEQAAGVDTAACYVFGPTPSTGTHARSGA